MVMRTVEPLSKEEWIHLMEILERGPTEAQKKMYVEADRIFASSQAESRTRAAPIE
ncbi:MAG: hypothetical protein MPI95_08125 [Nitrosopumilus sp.]|nr:hypothetical protein [Nitrosopumilus sp.]MDA7942653.1 hypothetical protein [Nitrosopumilus sp.]MDA7959029.1 hypothetical protein [Nitrosopumilus sp.]MDA7960725.1 hypothetical protein [Nitrosopumilus sp.]MDA7998577.1 hypothetical protein [Nitrosopumilus sp.]